MSWPRGHICDGCRGGDHADCQTFDLDGDFKGAYRMCACFYDDVDMHRWVRDVLPELVELIGVERLAA